jgi:DNA-binding beta-propeller fold protein YncE
MTLFAGVERLALLVAFALFHVEYADAAAVNSGRADSLYMQIADVPLGAKTSRFDYQSFDSSTGRLFIAEMGSAKLLVFDTRRQSLVASLDGFPKITGVLDVPELHKLYASVPGGGIAASASVALGMAGLSSGSGKIAILNDVSLKEITRVPGGVFPDGIAYDPDDRLIVVSDELGNAIEIIDAQTDMVIARIDAGGQVGNVQYDPITKRVYAPIQSRNELIALDPKTKQVVARHALPGARHPHGLRIATGEAIGYVACDENDRMMVVDLRSGNLLATQPLGHDPDVLADDPALHRLYVAGEGGILSVFDIVNASMPTKLGDVFVGEDAHSVAVDPASHRLFLPLRDVKGGAVLRILEPKSQR